MFKELKEKPKTRPKYKKMNLSDMMPVILPILRKRWFSHRSLNQLKLFISRRKNAYEDNLIKVHEFKFFEFKTFFIFCFKFYWCL